MGEHVGLARPITSEEADAITSLMDAGYAPAAARDIALKRGRHADPPPPPPADPGPWPKPKTPPMTDEMQARVLELIGTGVAPRAAMARVRAAAGPQLTREDLKHMTPEAITQAQADGRLDDLLNNNPQEKP